MDKYRNDKMSNSFFIILAVLAVAMLVMIVVVSLMLLDVASQDVPNIDGPVETTGIESTE